MIQIGNGGTPPSSRIETPVELFFIKGTAVPTTLAAETAIGDVEITVVDGTNLQADGYLGIFSPDASRFFFSEIISESSNVVTVDTPLDFAFSVGDNVQPLSRELNIDGSTTPTEFKIQGAGTGSNIAINITRFMFSMECDTAVDLNKFGDLTALTNGIVLRRSNGQTRNIFNVKRNSDLVELAYDVTFYDSSNPSQGVDGVSCRYTFNGEDKHGTALQLLPGDSLDLLVQDDLSGLLKFRILGQGYETTICCQPEIFDIPVGDTPTPVATNITKGFIHPINQRVKYMQYYQPTGLTAPTTRDDFIEFDMPGIEIRSSTGIDVYLAVAGDGTDPGRIRIDL